MPVQPCLTNLTNTTRAFHILLASPAIRHTRLACYTHHCQAYNVRSVWIVQLSVMTAIYVVIFRAPQFYSCSVVQSLTGVPFSSFRCSGAAMCARIGTNPRSTLKIPWNEFNSVTLVGFGSPPVWSAASLLCHYQNLLRDWYNQFVPGEEVFLQSQWYASSRR